MRGQRDQRALLFGEGLVDDPAGGGVDARIGDLDAPIVELRVGIVEAAEGPVEEEVLADVAERPLDLALGLRPVGFAGLGRRSVVVEQGDQRRVVDRRSVGALSQDGGLHPVAGASFVAPPQAWHPGTVSSFWSAQNRPHSHRLHPRTNENRWTFRTTPGSSANSVLNSAKSAWACSPGLVSKRRSNLGVASGRSRSTARCHYYILSRTMSPEDFLKAVRNHWAIENRLHWVLDVQMREDDLRNRAGCGPENLAAVRGLVVSMVHQMDDKLSIRRRL